MVIYHGCKPVKHVPKKTKIQALAGVIIWHHTKQGTKEEIPQNLQIFASRMGNLMIPVLGDLFGGKLLSSKKLREVAAKNKFDQGQLSKTILKGFWWTSKTKH